jgi:TusE/DsrC/DsvC family sulfur relay protein
MAVATIELVDVARNDEGFFLDPSQWSEAMVPALAEQEGISDLTDRHWQVIRFMRSEYLEKGTGPTVRVLGKAPASPSRSSTNCSPRVRQRWPHGLPESPSRAAASEEEDLT